jgi:hypothetical protein
MGGIECLISLRECKLGAPGPGERRFGSIGYWQKLVKREAVAAVSLLQQLSLLSITSTYDISSRTAPGLSTLTSLRDLGFKHCHRVDAAGLLEPLTALTRLHLQDMDVLLPQLLRVLPLLQQLEVFVVYGNRMRIVGLPLNHSYEDFAALTASSKLKTLRFQPRGTPLPPAAFAAMFGGSKQLTALTDLMFITNPHETRGLGTTELQAIARSCPNLFGLTARGCVQPHSDWSALSQLQYFRGLEASHASNADVGLIASFVQLEYLVFSSPNSVTFAGVQRLTALTNLTLLDVPSTDSTVSGWLYKKGGAGHVGDCLDCAKNRRHRPTLCNRY